MNTSLPDGVDGNGEPQVPAPVDAAGSALRSQLPPSNSESRLSWRGAPLALRLPHFKTIIFVAHPLAAAVIGAINQRKTVRLVSGHARGVLVTASPGVGKTRLIEYMSAQSPPQVMRELLNPLDEDSRLTRQARGSIGHGGDS